MIDIQEVLVIHDTLIVQFGGSNGIRDYNQAVRHVRAAACRTTNKFGSPNQQQEIKKCW